MPDTTPSVDVVEDHLTASVGGDAVTNPAEQAASTEGEQHPSSSKSKDYRPELDGIRALAVAMVIAFHLGFGWMPGGFIGVDVFFVLSGFLITGLLIGEARKRGRVRFGRFYARRARRLLPAAALTLTVVMIAAHYLLPIGDRWSLWQDVKSAALYIANWHLIWDNRDYFAPGRIPGPIEHWWSLAVEEQFYFIWPLLLSGLWWAFARRSQRHRRMLPDAIGALLAASVVLSLAFTRPGGPLRYYATYTRAYHLLAGALLALYVARRREHPGGRPIFGVAIAALSFGWLVWQATSIRGASGYPGFAGIGVTIASVGLIWALSAFPDGWAHRAFGAGPLAAMGRLSYSLYLWHWPVIVFVPIAAKRWGILGGGTNPALLVGLTFAAAMCSYFAFERPIRFKLWPKAPAILVILAGLGTSIAVASVSGRVLVPGDALSAKIVAAARDIPSSAPCPYREKDFVGRFARHACLFHKGSGPTVALVGDSHAEQYLPALIALSQRLDFSLVLATRTGCGFDDNLGSIVDESGRLDRKTACDDWRDTVFPTIAPEFHPDVVLAGTRSHIVGIWQGSTLVRPSAGAAHRALWAQGVERATKTLGSGGARVVFLRDLPVPPADVPDCLNKHRNQPAACNYRASSDASRDPYNAIFDSLAARSDRLDVVSIEKSVCPNGICPAVIDGEITHRDDNHLTGSFSRRLADELASALRAIGIDL